MAPPCGDVACQECQALRAILVTVIYVRVVVSPIMSKGFELYLQTKLAVPSFYGRFFDGVYASICLSAEADVLCWVFLSGPPSGIILLSFVPHLWLISRLIIRLND